MTQAREKIRIARQLSPTLTPEERLRILRETAGIWKNRKPDPMKELKKMREESEVRMKKLERQWRSYGKKKK